MTTVVDGSPERPSARPPAQDRGRLGPVGLIARRAPQLTRAVLKGGIALAVLAAWAPVLLWGFIYDEHITAWVTQDGLGDAITRAQEHQGNSPLYFAIVWVVRQLIGGSAAALRLPSFLAVIGAAYQLYRYGEESDRRDVGLIAAFALVANTDVIVRGLTARPYGLLLFLLALSIRRLGRYLTTYRRRDGLVWVIAAVASLYMTPFSAVMLVPHAVVLLHRRRFELMPTGDRWLFAVLSVALAVPLAPQVLDLAQRSDSLVVSRQPSIEDLMQFVVPSIGVVAVVAGFIVGGFGNRLDNRDVVWRTAVAWAVVPIVLLYLVGVMGTPIVGVSRYRLGAAPGAALVVAILIGRLRRPIGVLVAVTTLVVLSVLQLSHAPDEREWWREATHWVQDRIEGTDAIVAYDFGLIEQADVDQVADPHYGDYFTAPALAYGIQHPVRPLPNISNEQATAYLDELFLDLTEHDTIALVAKRRLGGPDYRDEFADRLADLGYREIQGPVYRLVESSVYVRD